jgi:hypothetical protein
MMISKRISPLFGGLIRGGLHDVYIPRIQRGYAYFATKALGATEPLLSVLVHFFEHGRWGFPLETGIDQQSLLPKISFSSSRRWGYI